MFIKLRQLKIVISAILIASIFLTPIVTPAQDLVAVSSITGGSVFVFRAAAKAVKRIASALRPSRSKAQRAESSTKIKRQYETIARNNPNKNRASSVDPNKIPAKNTLSPEQAAKVFAGVGEYYVEKHDFENALDKFRDAINLDPKNESAKLGYAEALAMKGTDRVEKDQFPEAKALYMEALTYDPNSSAAYFGLGEVYSELDQKPEAITNYERALGIDKDLTAIYVPLGILYYQTGEIAKADNLLSKAIVTSPESAETQYFLGLIRSSQNRNEEALAAFQTATTIDPKYVEAYAELGAALDVLKRPQDAIAAYQKALALKDDNFDAWLGLGGTYFEIGAYPESVMAYTRAKKIKNNQWEVYAGLGDASLKTESFNEAASNFNLAITFLTSKKDFNKDTAADLYSKIGFAIGQQCPINLSKFMPCQWPSAIKALEKAVELGGKPIDYTNLGWAYFNASRVDRDEKRVADQQAKLQLAKAALETAINANPPFLYSVLQNYGAVQNDLGDYRGAVETLKQVIAKQPEWAFSRYALGSAYFMLGEYDNAAAEFRGALLSDPNYIAALSSLGSLEVKRKNGKEARKILEQLRVKDPQAALRLEREIKIANLK